MDDRRAARRALGCSLKWPLRLSVCVAIALALTTTPVLGDWTPPPNPKPDKILSEAQDDARAGRYADALAKHVWFFDNALKYAPAMYGVRLSFALSYWHELALVYPPALAKLESVRDDAAANVREGRDPRHSFHDVASINRELGDEPQTKDLFLWLDSKSPEIARQVFDIAEPALLQAKEYRLCGKYLDPDGAFHRIADLYRETKRMATDPAGGMGDYAKDLEEHSNRSFANGAATLVALLVLNDRQADAERIANEALKESDDPALKAMLQSALNGELPPRWP
jgi:hypothetical protein